MNKKNGKLVFLSTLIFLFLAVISVGAAQEEKKDKKKEPAKNNETSTTTKQDTVIQGHDLGFDNNATSTTIAQTAGIKGHVLGSDNNEVPENPREEVNYINGKREGQSIVRYKNGSRIEGEYANGMKNGIWITYRSNGKKAWQESYKNDMKDGIWIFYDANEKKIKQESYKDGSRDGKFITWSEKNGVKTSEIDYQNDYLHGKKYTWFEDGRLSSEYGFLNGKLHGHSISWHFNGAKHFEGDYTEGTGKYKGWYESGKLFCEGEKRNGIKFGKDTCWYESGQKEREQEYNEEGKNIGKFTHWYEDGKIAYEMEYDLNGRCLYKKDYDKDGNLIFINNQPVDKKKTINNQLAFPPLFDLRNPPPPYVPQVTPVRNQFRFDTCWVFAWMGAVEHNVMPTNPVPQYSPLHLADKNHGYGKNGITGGSPGSAIAYLIRGGGPIDETTVPYATLQGEPLNVTGKQISYPPVKWVREVRMNRNILYTQHGSDFVQDCIYIKKTGGVITGFYMDESLFRDDHDSYYNASFYSELNHENIIVGWDNNYNKDYFPESNGHKPTNNGAIIMKNSWGVWGESGFFYVSPETSSLAAKYAITSVQEPTCKYIYQYDPLGEISNFGYLRTNSTQAIWAANIFEAENPLLTDDILKSIGFFLYRDNYSQCSMNYSIEVYTNVHHPSDPTQKPNDPTHGTLAATIVGQGDDQVNYPWYYFGGYFTVDLPNQVTNPVKIRGGTKFSVVIKYTRHPSYTIYNYMAFPIEKKFVWHRPPPNQTIESNDSNNASHWPGESFVSYDGEHWSDLSADGNACIKAFTEGDFVIDNHYWKLKEALDDPTLNVNSDNGYNLNWMRVSDDSHPGNKNRFVAKSDWINVGERCHMDATVDGPKIISFYWKVSSDPGNSLKFYVDGIEKKSISGTVENPSTAWQQEQISILTPGSHKLEWSYEKTLTPTITVADCGWVDGFCQANEFKVISPNSGEGWPRGARQSITWICGDITGNLSIELLKDDALIGLIAEVPATPGIYIWDVGTWTGGQVTPGPGYKIRIRTPDGSLIKARLQKP